jgi:LPS sulfotransferase NodH
MSAAISYVIASVQRSGTHLLCSILRGTGVAGYPEEYFLSKPGETWEKRWGAPSRDAHVQQVLRQNITTNGVFGTVVMWSYFERMVQMLQQIPAHKNLTTASVLAAVFGDPKYIWMRRRNHVEQAVSWAIACQTGLWAQPRDKKLEPRASPKFDFKVIDEWCNRIAAHEAGWENYFRENQIQPLVLCYEDLVASHRAGAERVLDFLGLPIPPDMEIPPPTVEKQATRISEQWTTRYLRLKKARTSRLARIFRHTRI